MSTWGNETAYTSKYALTTGIIICTNGKFDESGGYFGQPPGWHIPVFFASSKAHKTLKEALAAAEKQRVKKIKSLKKQIERLESLEIKVKEDK
jgi:hypothetical protein